MDYYQSNWDRYWHSIRDEPQGAPWDVMPEDAGERDFQLFKDYLPPQLPIADLGCGSGTQTLFLSKKYPQVIGLDVAPQAIEIAQKKMPAPNITYQVFNALDNEKARVLHQRFGDINIYMRGTLQQIKTEDREHFVTSLKILLGAKGGLFLIGFLSKSCLMLKIISPIWRDKRGDFHRPYARFSCNGQPVWSVSAKQIFSGSSRHTTSISSKSGYQTSLRVRSPMFASPPVMRL